MKKSRRERLDIGSCTNDTTEFDSFSFEKSNNSNNNESESQSMIRVYCQFVLAQYKLIDMKQVKNYEKVN